MLSASKFQSRIVPSSLRTSFDGVWNQARCFAKTSKQEKLAFRRKDKKRHAQLPDVAARKTGTTSRPGEVMLSLRNFLAMKPEEASLMVTEAQSERERLEKRRKKRQQEPGKEQAKAPSEAQPPAEEAEAGEEGEVQEKRQRGGRQPINWEKDPLRVIVVHPEGIGKEMGAEAGEFRLQEACALAEACGWHVVGRLRRRLRAPSPATFFGRGQAEELARLVERERANLVFVDAFLSPPQQRHLQDVFGQRREVRVVDRLATILEIFSIRAASRESRLQVQLAWLQYQRAFLIGRHSSLFEAQQQRGGHGFVGGAGEKQLELERRNLDQQEARVRRELEQAARTRTLHREARRKADLVPIVALVGYTNAGKSALTNRICHSDLESNDAVFTSLSPHLRGMQLPSGLRALVLDSVGFITDLPAQLVDAFRATLEEIREAALLVHVRDISHPHAELQREAVLYQLRNMDLPPRLLAEHLEVWNKVDLLDRAEVARRLEACSPDGPRVFPLSATRGTGVTRFLRAIDEILSAQQGRRVYEVVFPQGDGEQLAFFYQRTKVLAHAEDEDAIPPRTVLKVSMDPATPRHAHYTRQFRPLGLTEVSMKPTRRPRRVV